MNPPRSASLYVVGLPLEDPRSLEPRILALFGHYGAVQRVDFRSRLPSVCFVHYSSAQHADAAVRALHRRPFYNGGPIDVSYSKSPASVNAPEPVTSSSPITTANTASTPPSPQYCSAAVPPPVPTVNIRAAAATLPPSSSRIRMETNVRERFVAGGASVRLEHDDLSRFKADVLVNAANALLRHNGGVARALVGAGGELIQRESDAWVAAHGPVPVGSVAWTSPGALNAQLLLHAVGPDLRPPASYDAVVHNGLLAAAITSALRIANSRGMRSIALPPISSGNFGFPKEKCAAVMWKAIDVFCSTELCATSSLREISVVVLDVDTAATYASALDNVWRVDDEDSSGDEQPAQKPTARLPPAVGVYVDDEPTQRGLEQRLPQQPIPAKTSGVEAYIDDEPTQRGRGSPYRAEHQRLSPPSQSSLSPQSPGAEVYIDDEPAQRGYRSSSPAARP